MTTARFAERQARKVFAMKSEDLRKGQGTNCLTEKGVTPYTGVDFFLNELNLPTTR
ncbi:hypothetical protein [Guptibacillus hwajinpoensis]|uniref:hypothetical protein n=1 Tax=Guptibacillus hwajinpoensis TaxID=208199 RepID=UPI003D6BA8FA